MTTILLVEDDPNIVKMLQLFFQKSEYKILAAKNGLQALDVLNQQRPDLIVSDIMMPVMNGYEFRNVLLKDERMRLIPFVFLSAKGKPKEIVQGMELNVDDYIPKPFDPEVFMARIHAIIERYKEFGRLIYHDALTGLYNRRALDDFLKQELERVERYQRRMSLLLLDIDHFKRVNDNYGHDFGDVVLQRISSVLKSTIREIDYAGRYGGEEFIILMPETGKSEGFIAANRIRLAVKSILWDKDDFSVAISGGLVTAPEDGLEGSRLIKKSDMALYLAKEGGRNQIRKF